MGFIIKGQIIQALAPQGGVSQRGNQWARQSYIIEHESGQYPKRMVFDVRDAKIQEFNLQIGEWVTLHLNCDVREYPEGSGKFFNGIDAWKVERQGQQMQQGYQQQGYQQQIPMQQGFQQPMQQQVVQSPFPPQGQQMVQQPMQQQVQNPFPPQQPAASPFPPQVNAQGQPIQQPMQQAPAQQQQQMPQGQQQSQQAPLPFPPQQ